MPLAARLLDSIFDWLAPRECAACGTDSHCGLCADCRSALVAPSARDLGGVPVFARCVYRAPIDRAIHRFKYQSRPDFAKALAALVPRPDVDIDGALLVPVPLHASRLVERGYNQSALMARSLRSRWKLECAPLALERRIATTRQAGLGLREREVNVRGVFGARHPERLADRPILLVDDVVTTGSTALGCIEALRRSGARPIGVLCVALTANHA